MIKTLLIDLDNTLLRNEMDSFLPAYLQALAKHMSPTIEPAFLIKTLMQATAKMTANHRPDMTLMEVFDQAFYPALGFEKSELEGLLDNFYAVEFPRLKSTTAPIPEAPELIQQTLSRGYQIGIATNPLFPRTAILQRLSWAGLPAERYPFALIPSYDTFHFSKPNPTFFIEFLAQMGWPEGTVLMAGDDAELDILPARQAGLPVFWIPAQVEAVWNAPGEEPPRGALKELLPWSESSNQKPFQVNYNLPEIITAVLCSTPAALQTMTRQLTLDLWTDKPSSGEWSLTEIICHLRDVDAEVNLPRLRKVIETDNPFLAGQNTDLWAEERQYRHQDAMQAMQAFIASRLNILELINNINPEDWNRPARHAIFGPTHFKELVKIIAEHDRLHIRQVFTLIQSNRKD